MKLTRPRMKHTWRAFEMNSCHHPCSHLAADNKRMISVPLDDCSTAFSTHALMDFPYGGLQKQLPGQMQFRALTSGVQNSAALTGLSFVVHTSKGICPPKYVATG